jgi:hypothetical protein
MKIRQNRKTQKFYAGFDLSQGQSSPMSANRFPRELKNNCAQNFSLLTQQDD